MTFLSQFMHLSMLSPRVGGGYPGKFDIFREARVKCPIPGQLLNAKLQPLPVAFSLKVKKLGYHV